MHPNHPLTPLVPIRSPQLVQPVDAHVMHVVLAYLSDVDAPLLLEPYLPTGARHLGLGAVQGLQPLCSVHREMKGHKVASRYILQLVHATVGSVLCRVYRFSAQRTLYCAAQRNERSTHHLPILPRRYVRELWGLPSREQGFPRPSRVRVGRFGEERSSLLQHKIDGSALHCVTLTMPRLQIPLAARLVNSCLLRWYGAMHNLHLV